MIVFDELFVTWLLVAAVVVLLLLGDTLDPCDERDHVAAGESGRQDHGVERTVGAGLGVHLGKALVRQAVQVVHAADLERSERSQAAALE